MTTGEAVKWLIYQHGAIDKGCSCKDCNILAFIHKRLEAFEAMRGALEECLGYVTSDYETRAGGFGGAQPTVDRARAALKLAEETKP